MRKLLLGLAFATIAAQSTPSFASSLATEAFVANVRLEAFFLEQSSASARDHADSSPLREFAEREEKASARLMVELNRRFGPEIAQAMPMTVASNELLTGRSAAVDRSKVEDGFAPPAGAGALMPATMVALDYLSSRRGQAFDQLYKATQISILRRLAAFLNAYALTGDDVALRQLAKSELTATIDRIAELARI